MLTAQSFMPITGKSLVPIPLRTPTTAYDNVQRQNNNNKCKSVFLLEFLSFFSFRHQPRSFLRSRYYVICLHIISLKRKNYCHSLPSLPLTRCFGVRRDATMGIYLSIIQIGRSHSISVSVHFQLGRRTNEPTTKKSQRIFSTFNYTVNAPSFRMLKTPLLFVVIAARRCFLSSVGRLYCASCR